MPVLDVNVWPPCGVPEIVGNDVFTGTDWPGPAKVLADADEVRETTTTRSAEAMSTVRCLGLMNFMSLR